MKKIFSTILIAGIGGLSSVALYKQMESETKENYISTSQPVNVRYANYAASAAETGIEFTNAASMTIHSVVHVKTEYQNDQNQFFFYDPFRDFFGGRGQNQQPSLPPQLGSGSGVIISEDGYIVTNNHVIEKAEKIEVVLNNKRTYKAELIGKDPTTDIALLKISEKGLPNINFGNSDNVKVGQWVLAVGNPFNLTSTVTAGIVSAKGRSINILENDPARGIFPIESFIQTDAAVNPGNSGGALVNTAGELIGINSAIASNTGSFTGYSFAIPVNIVKKITSDLVEFGTVQRAFMGVSIRDLDAKLAEEKGIKEYKGVFISGLTEGGSAEGSGVKEGDVITKIGEVEVNSAPELQEQVSRYRPGDKVLVTLLREGKPKEILITMKNKNGNTDVLKKESEEIINVLGASFLSATSEEKKKLNITSGLKIVKMDAGKLRSAGIKEGFIITSIDKKPINSPQDIKAILEDKRGGVLIEGVYPNGLRAYYGFGL